MKLLHISWLGGEALAKHDALFRAYSTEQLESAEQLSPSDEHLESAEQDARPKVSQKTGD